MDEILTHVTEGDLVGWPGFELDTTTNSFVSMIWQARKKIYMENHLNRFLQSLALKSYKAFHLSHFQNWNHSWF